VIRRQRGVALVLVMWAAVILAVIAASFIAERRTETLVVRNSLSMARARWPRTRASVAPCTTCIARTSRRLEARRHAARMDLRRRSRARHDPRRVC
jgi:type II secretory pathway component PulK